MGSLVSQIPNFVRRQPTAIFIRSPFPIGTLQPISGLVELKSLNLGFCREMTGTVLMFGNNQLAISLADLQVHLNRWRGSANYRSSISFARVLLVSQNPRVVGTQPRGSLIGGTGGLRALQNLNQLTELNLAFCENLTGAFR